VVDSGVGAAGGWADPLVALSQPAGATIVASPPSVGAWPNAGVASEAVPVCWERKAVVSEVVSDRPRSARPAPGECAPGFAEPGRPYSGIAVSPETSRPTGAVPGRGDGDPSPRLPGVGA